MRSALACMSLMFLGLIFLVSCEGTPAMLSMQPVTSPEGWHGTAFFRNGIVASEEFVTGKNGRAIDLWRYYDINGNMIAEERDTNNDGLRDYHRGFSEGQLVIVKEDLNRDGKYEIITEYPIGKEVPVSQPSIAVRPAAPTASVQPGSGKPQPRNKAEIIDEEVEVVKDDSGDEEVTVTTREKVVTPVEVVKPEETVVVEERKEIVIEEDEEEKPGSIIRKLDFRNTAYPDSPTRDTKVVPGPVFHHPSDDLEE